MRKWLALGTAVAALFGGAALAEELTGAIESIDEATHMMTVEGHNFKVDPNNVVGMTLDELEVGDTVHVTYEQNGGAETNEINAMTVDKVE